MSDAREKLRRFRDLNLLCTMCKRDDHPIYPWTICDGHASAPICFACMSFHGRPGVDAITPALEKIIHEYFAREKAFWHPGESIGPVTPPKENSDGQTDAA
jgi:hypothetical protein